MLLHHHTKSTIGEKLAHPYFAYDFANNRPAEHASLEKLMISES